MDWGSLIGIALALLGIVVGQAMEGGHLASLVQPAAFVIVVVGTAGAVLLQSGLRNFKRGLKLGRQVFISATDEEKKVADNIMQWSAIARREGLLSLDRYVDAVNDPFLKKGLRLVVDGVDPVKIREILDADITAFEMDQRQALKIWEAAGGYAPTIGILGAVLGLIHVMENLSDPSRLGGGIAVAFVATIYGVGLANLVFLPIGSKLKAMLSQQIMRRDMLADSFVSIANGDNPRVLTERMMIYQGQQ